jgi:hypothetical protein
VATGCSAGASVATGCSAGASVTGAEVGVALVHAESSIANTMNKVISDQTDFFAFMFFFLLLVTQVKLDTIKMGSILHVLTASPPQTILHRVRKLSLINCRALISGMFSA